MKRRVAWIGVMVLVLVVGAVGVFVGRAYAQEGPQRVTVPKSWGTFKGTRVSDLVFEDKDGTIRIVELFQYGQDGRWILEAREKVRITRPGN